MTDEEIIREYHEAVYAHKVRLCEERASDALATLPEDVRAARVELACLKEADRARAAAIAMDVLKQAREERWIAAHEDLVPFRQVQKAQQ